jgi:hypothetical protein
MKMVSPPAGAYIPSFTIYHLLPDLPAIYGLRNEIVPEIVHHTVLQCRTVVRDTIVADNECGSEAVYGIHDIALHLCALCPLVTTLVAPFDATLHRS